MAELRTLARPYAQAVFAHARATETLAAWGETLAWLAAVVQDAAMQRVLKDPRTTPERATELFACLGGEQLSPEARNLIRLMASNRRLLLLPQLTTLYAELRAEQENSLMVTLHSAFGLSAAQQAQIQAALSKRYQRQVQVQEQSAPELVGGFVVQAGDQVMDGSVRARLQKLAATLRAQVG